VFILDFPIEPIETRYSKQWHRWFLEAFKRWNIPYETLFIPNYDFPPSTISSSEFLDPNVTFGWKFTQLRKAVSLLSMAGPKESTVVCFLHDAWFPGIESLKYVAEMRGINLKIVGFWHAGSYLSNDLLGIKGFHKWVKGSECTWFRMCDAICVGSQYHKERMLASLGWIDKDADKVHVTGYPIEVPDIQCEKENIVVWPHRIAEDKHPELFDRLAWQFQGSNWKFIKSKEVCETKNEYYRLLARSKIAVSTATMETFGIAMVEAACLGCMCLVPDDLCYPEIHPQYSLCKDISDMEYQLGAYMAQMERGYIGVSTKNILRKKYHQETVTDRICEIIKEVGCG